VTMAMKLLLVKLCYILCTYKYIRVAGEGHSHGMTRPEQELLAKYLLQRLLGKDGPTMDPAIARIARDNLETSASIVYPEYEYEDTEDSDYQYEQEDEQDPELVQKPSQTIATIVPAPSNLKTEYKYCADCKSVQSPANSRFSMPLTKLGVKKYYLGIFFKANWARAAQYCRYHGMHLASINTEVEQTNIEKHIESLGLGHEHFWTSGTDQAEEGKFFWMSTGKPLTYENWNKGEPNNYKYEGGENEHCLELWNRDGKGLKWNDSPCSFETFFICEV